MTKPFSNEVINIGDSVVGSPNSPLEVIVETFNATKLGIYFESGGGNFNGQTINYDVSGDGINWIFNSTGSLSAGTSKTSKKFLSQGSTGIEALDFPFMRITVPALGPEISCRVSYGGKP